MFFFARADADIRWSADGAFAARKFCERVQRLVEDCADVVRSVPEGAKTPSGSPKAKGVRRAAHEALSRFDTAFGGELCFNTGIAGVYELLNAFPSPAEVAAAPDADKAAYAEAIRMLVLMLAPITPHLCEELHERLWGSEIASVHRRPWPKVDPAALVRDEVEIAVQVNGKIKDRVNVPSDADEKRLEAIALALPKVAAAVAGKPPRKVVVVKGRLVNVIV
jgi:leucyl-tRNA synthetase